MNYLFPEIEQQNKKTLVVIGNGFDLANGIESSYGNFKEWLQKNSKHRLIGLMDTFLVINGMYGVILKKPLENTMKIVFWSIVNPTRILIMTILLVRWRQWKIHRIGYSDQYWMSFLKNSEIG